MLFWKRTGYKEFISICNGANNTHLQSHPINSKSLRLKVFIELSVNRIRRYELIMLPPKMIISSFFYQTLIFDA